MKNLTSIFITIIVVLVSVSCSSDSSVYDPFKEQTKQPFYPARLSFRSVNDNGAITEKNWVFEYNSDNTIKRYTYTHSVSGTNIDIEETKVGNLRYYTDYKGNRCIETKSYSSYSSKRLADILVYTDTITEDARFNNNHIESIDTKGWRTTNGETVTTLSSRQTFNYSNDLCTSSTYTDSNNETTYTYKWNNNMLAVVTIHNQSKNNSDLTHDTYEYRYDNRTLASYYEFNPLAFVYGNKPQIYDAMGYLGKSTPYLLEFEEYNGYESINGKRYDIQSVQRSYHIMSGANSLIYSAESPGYSEYIFNFNN